MYLPRILSVCLSVILMPQAALADRLGAKWEDDRKLYNQMGDKAKAGEAGVLYLLNEFAAAGEAPAMHNLGWLFEHGSTGTPKDHDRSCAYYKEGSDLNYPPSQHSYALCLYQRAEKDRLGGPEGWEDTRYKADILMLDAAENGWVGSALYVSKDLMNRFDFVPDYATAALAAIENGLQSLPNDAQKRDLTYMKGIAHIYGPQPRDLKAAEAALLYARDHGHTAAVKALPFVYKEWAQKVSRRILKWEPVPISIEDCYDDVQNPEVPLSELALCRSSFKGIGPQMDKLGRDVNYLWGQLEELSKTYQNKDIYSIHRNLSGIITLFDEKKQAYGQAVEVFGEKFIPHYLKRLEAGE